MSGAPSDSYLGGLFSTTSAGNLSRRMKRRKQRNVQYLQFGEGVVRRRGGDKKPRKPPKGRAQSSPRLDEFAELLAEGLSVQEAAEKMGATFSKARGYLSRIRKRLGPQAV